MQACRWSRFSKKERGSNDLSDHEPLIDWKKKILCEGELTEDFF